MQSVSRSVWLPYRPKQIYQVLTDPDKLAAIVKRLEHIEVLERNGEEGKVMATIDLPGGKSLETPGYVQGVPEQRLSFSTKEPVVLNIIWQLSPATEEGIAGTAIIYTIEVDFSPVATFISGVMLKGYISSEMKRDLRTLERIMERLSNPA